MVYVITDANLFSKHVCRRPALQWCKILSTQRCTTEFLLTTSNGWDSRLYTSDLTDTVSRIYFFPVKLDSKRILLKFALAG